MRVSISTLAIAAPLCLLLGGSASWTAGAAGAMPTKSARGPIATALAVRGAPNAFRKTILYNFGVQPDGALPAAPLVIDKTGALYGTTRSGGTHTCFRYGLHCGTVFKLMPSGTGYKESILHDFGFGGDGNEPVSLIMDGTGALYGTTYRGGSKTVCLGHGCGIVFKLSPSKVGYRYTVLHRFQSGSDAATPGFAADLIMDDKGALYGTTISGGGGSQCAPYGCGAVFKLTPSRNGYQESVVYAFGGVEGTDPEGGVIIDKAGALYGTTWSGGQYDEGTAFKLTPTAAGYMHSTLYNFTGKADGGMPDAGLVAGKTGALYGPTYFGGSPQCNCGTVFKLKPSGASYIESVIYSFQGGLVDGRPSGLIRDESGALYGTTPQGGNGHCGSEPCGTVFRLTPSGTGYQPRILYSFQNYPDGAYPYAGVTRDSSGALYGATSTGGASDKGTVFKLAPQ